MVLNMTPVLAKMNRDGISTRTLGQQGRIYRARIIRTPRLTQRRNMINIHSQEDI
jgi:hypothetical protein